MSKVVTLKMKKLVKESVKAAKDIPQNLEKGGEEINEVF